MDINIHISDKSSNDPTPVRSETCSGLTKANSGAAQRAPPSGPSLQSPHFPSHVRHVT